MQHRKHFSAKIVILFLVKVTVIRAECYWDYNETQKYCTISCGSSNLASGQETIDVNLAQLERKWAERPQCHDEGINLELRNLLYPNYVVQSHWFTAKVKVKELDFSMSSVLEIEVDAFNADAFKTVKKLTLQTLTQVNRLKKGIFNGLDSLVALNIPNCKLKVIETGVLDALNKTLKEFTVVESSKYNTEIVIDGFTGSEEMHELTYVKYRYNLESSITHKSFVGLKNVITLDLSECQIVTIGEGSFDPISGTVEELKLEKNLIATIPYGLFDALLPSHTANIYLDGNRFNCNCDLMPLKMYILEHLNFIGTINCHTPDKWKGYSVADTDFCDSPPETTTTSSTSTTTKKTPSETPSKTTSAKPSKTTTSSTETTTATLTTTTTEDPTTTSTEDPTTTSISSSTTNEPPDEFQQECFRLGSNDISKIVDIKSPRQTISIQEHESGDIIVQIDVATENSALIWFSSEKQIENSNDGNAINCLTEAGSSIPINNLMDDSAYTFCLMDSTEKTVSPLDCISYAKRSVTPEQPWIYESSKSLVIAMISFACCLSVSIGVIIGYFTLKAVFVSRTRNQNLSNNIGIIDVLAETLNSNRIMREQNRISKMSSDSCYTKRVTNTTLQYYLDNAPPLPARPAPMFPFEEPFYATIGGDIALNKR